MASWTEPKKIVRLGWKKQLWTQKRGSYKSLRDDINTLFVANLIFYIFCENDSL